jgi:Leucine-rich repeat (LRR) protein
MCAACLHVIVDRDDAEDDSEVAEVEWSNTLAALPPALVTLLAVHPSFGLPSAISALTDLTRLELTYTEKKFPDEEIGCWPFSTSAHHLRPLTRLRQLTCYNVDIGSNAGSLLSLPAHAGLQALTLNSCRLQATPQALPALTQLTSLSLAGNHSIITVPLATLQRLQSLDLSYCSLTAVPEHFSALTALTRLDLSFNFELAGDWQHLQPLSLLQDLGLEDSNLTAVPQHLSAMTALTRLKLCNNEELVGGWQHLLPLIQLHELDLILADSKQCRSSCQV